jgi:hypothetical protein
VTKVTIVSRTRMKSGVCIGGLTREDHRSVRLLPATGDHAHPADAPYKVGDVWDLELRPALAIERPHVEDALVVGGRRVAPQMGLGTWLAANTHPWTGGAEALYDGKLRLTPSGRAYISRDDVSSVSVGFWLPNRDLVLDETGTRYTAPWRDNQISVAYVGECAPEPFICAGTLVRVSLSRWLLTRTGIEGCWLQISGWYPPPTPRNHPASQAAGLRGWLRDRLASRPRGIAADTAVPGGTAVAAHRPSRQGDRPGFGDPHRGATTSRPSPVASSPRPSQRSTNPHPTFQVCLSCGSVLDSDARGCWKCTDRD